MKRTVVIALSCVGLLAAGLGLLAWMEPDVVRVERSVLLDAEPALVWPFIDDLRKIELWNPWAQSDPDMKVVYGEQTAGLGGSYTWAGNADVGAGTRTIVESVEDVSAVHRMDAVEPFPFQAMFSFQLEPSGEQTRVTMEFAMYQTTLTRFLTATIMNMEKDVGPDLEYGLGVLKKHVDRSAGQSSSPPSSP
jgi:hypothetical protein